MPYRDAYRQPIESLQISFRDKEFSYG